MEGGGREATAGLEKFCSIEKGEGEREVPLLAPWEGKGGEGRRGEGDWGEEIVAGSGREGKEEEEEERKGLGTTAKETVCPLPSLSSVPYLSFLSVSFDSSSTPLFTSDELQN